MEIPMTDAHRKRLLYRANYRGFKEADILLGGFAKDNMDNLTDTEVATFEALLEVNDHDIYSWITGKVETPVEYDTPLFDKIKAYRP